MTTTNTKKTVTLKPGILVALRTTVSGGVQYERRTLEADDRGAEDGTTAISKWETTKVVQDPDEVDRATAARGKAGAEIRKLCTRTSFGLLCTLANEPELNEAISRARTIADEYNATAVHTRVGVYVLKGHIASTDEEAARAIGDEVRELVDAMNAGITTLNVEAIRDAAKRAKEMAEVLSDDAATVLTEAVKAARTAARVIVKRIQEDGEQASIVLADIQRGAIEKARFAFLDLDDAPVIAPEVPAAPAGNVTRIAALDLDGDAEGKVA